jgi:phosphoribosyl 1,2-cyclic phosphodiesterase
MSIRVKFWGVRGNIACPSPEYFAYGGNTACVELDLGGTRVILDAGTGIRQLGDEYLKQGIKDFYILMSHVHADHLAGLNYFKPIYIPGHSIHMLAGHLRGETWMTQAISEHMREEVHPMQYQMLPSNFVCEDFMAGKKFYITLDIRVVTAALNHPGGSCGYRIEYGEQTICYVTDTEHVAGETDQNIVELIRDADLVIYDTTFTEEEWPTRKGWGHSTWQEGLRLCKLAGAKKMAMFHYSPDYDDEALDKMSAEARAAWDGIIAAKDGMELILTKDVDS